MKAVLGIVSTLFLVASPFVLYWTLTHHDVAVAAVTLIAWAVVRIIPVLLSAKREQKWAALQLSAIALVFAATGWILDSGVWLLVLPSATQATFGLTFLRSVDRKRSRTPLIEHFARMVKAELSVDEQAHCRRWTVIWGCYLLVLAALGLVLAYAATLAVWTLYVGFVNYVLVGALFAVEYVIRKIRFRDYGRNPVDWLLARLFPAPPRRVPGC
jgi:uncharacterized membrane protein